MEILFFFITYRLELVIPLFHSVAQLINAFRQWSSVCCPRELHGKAMLPVDRVQKHLTSGIHRSELQNINSTTINFIKLPYRKYRAHSIQKVTQIDR